MGNKKLSCMVEHLSEMQQQVIDTQRRRLRDGCYWSVPLSSALAKVASQDGWQEGAGVLERIAVELVTITATSAVVRGAGQDRRLLG